MKYRWLLSLTILSLMVALWPPLSPLAMAGGPDGGAAAVARTPITLTLEDAVNRGLEVNPALMAGQYRRYAAEERHKAARGELLPQVTADVGLRRLHNRSAAEYNQDYLDQRTNTYAIRLSQPLFAGFTAINTWRRAGLEAEQEEVRRQMLSLDIAHEIQILYLELIRVREDLRGAESAVERLESQLEAARAWFEVDMRPRLGVLQTTAELESARNRVVAVANAQRSLEARLAALLALPAVDAADYQDPILDNPPRAAFTVEQLLELARENRPDLRFARLGVERALTDQRIARGRYAPRVSLDMDYTKQDLNYRQAQAQDIDREHWSIGVNMRWELFAGGRNFYHSRGSGHELAAAEAELRDTENRIASEARQALLAYQDADARISGAREAVAAAREAFIAAQERYRTTLGTTTEVLDSQAQLTTAESELNQTRVERIQALAEIYRQVGLLRPALR